MLGESHKNGERISEAEMGGRGGQGGGRDKKIYINIFV